MVLFPYKDLKFGGICLLKSLVVEDVMPQRSTGLQTVSTCSPKVLTTRTGNIKQLQFQKTLFEGVKSQGLKYGTLMVSCFQNEAVDPAKLAKILLGCLPHMAQVVLLSTKGSLGFKFLE